MINKTNERGEVLCHICFEMINEPASVANVYLLSVPCRWKFVKEEIFRCGLRVYDYLWKILGIYSING